MDRNDGVWYYRLGGQTLGPVSWVSIDHLTRDTVAADTLLVARGGDLEWRPASEIIAHHPELTAEETEEDESASMEEPSQAGWLTASPPSGAAAEVLGEAARSRHTGRARVTVEEPWADPKHGMPPREGLGAWIGQAWQMVTMDAGAFIPAVLLAVLVTVVTIGICGPPMFAGLVVMAVKRFRGQEISAGTVFEGFQFFLPAWGVVLLEAIVGGLGGAVLGGAVGAVLGAVGADPESIELAARFLGGIISLVAAAIFFYAMVLVVDRGMGTTDAVRSSWALTSPNLPSYVGIVFVLQLLAGAGVLLCGIGVLLTAPLYPCAVVAAYMYHAGGR